MALAGPVWNGDHVSGSPVRHYNARCGVCGACVCPPSFNRQGASYAAPYPSRACGPPCDSANDSRHGSYYVEWELVGIWRRVAGMSPQCQRRRMALGRRRRITPTTQHRARSALLRALRVSSILQSAGASYAR